jgi:hypothetical protein
MECFRAEELLSDRLESALPLSLSRDVEAHLATCEQCRLLAECLAEVVDALRSYPALEPPSGLVERCASAALASREGARPTFRWPDLGLPVGLQVLAATLAIALTGVVLLAVSPGARLKERTVNAGVYLSERKDRVVEDIHLLRVVVTTAFEGRLDKMNDRVDDYRRLLERRRASEQEEKRSSSPQSQVGSVRSAHRAALPRTPFLSNSRVDACVGSDEGRGLRPHHPEGAMT